MEPLTLTVPKAARYLGIGRDLMYELVNSGQIRSFKVKNRTHVPRAACEEWLQGQITDSPQEPSGAKI